MTRFDPEGLFAVLAEHGVAYVVVRGFAAVAHGGPLPTYDVDIAPERTLDNLDRLVAALKDLQARIRTEGAPDGLPFPPRQRPAARRGGPQPRHAPR